ncbi:DNRLRE domain-containing protein [Paenibacillus algorifonticola]|uniref:DNRLRE domain-containing protein n=1 Tax=Paenibacillus algorifonticola TaxID=684063 RepID=UPI003D28B0F5
MNLAILMETTNKVWIVSTHGDDVKGTGSFLEPYATFEKALNSAVSGDGIYIEVGTYNLSPKVSDTFSQYGFGDLNKKLIIAGENENTILVYDGTKATYRDSVLCYFQNSGTIIANLTLSFKPRAATYSYSKAIAKNGNATFKNVYFKRDRTGVAWAFSYTQSNKFYNCIFDAGSNGAIKSMNAGAGNATYVNCIYDFLPNEGSITYGITRLITANDWDATLPLPSDINGKGDPNQLNLDGSRSHIGVRGGTDAWTPESANYRGLTQLESSIAAINPNYVNAPTNMPLPECKNIIYVSANGSDSGAGTVDRPFLTLPFAVAQASDGDLVYISEGIFQINNFSEIVKTGISLYGQGLSTVIELNGAINKVPTRCNYYKLCFRASKTSPILSYGFWTFSTTSSTINVGFYNCLFYDPFNKVNKGARHNTYIIGDSSSTVKNTYLKCEFINCLSVGTAIFSMWNDGTVLGAVRITNTVTNFTSLDRPNTETAHTATIQTTNLTSATFDGNFYVTSANWEGKGTGANPDGTISNIGLYGGTYAWGEWKAFGYQIPANININQINDLSTSIHVYRSDPFDDKICTAGFAGTSSGLFVLNNHTDLRLTNGTIEARIRTLNAGSGYRGIIVKQGAYSVFLNNNILGLYDWSSSVFRTTGLTLNDGEEHHVAVAFQLGVTNGTKVYLDGKLVLTTTVGLSHQNTSLAIGNGSNPSNAQSFTGEIREVRVWKTILSASEVYDSMFEYNPLKQGLVLYYNMKSYDGTIMYDITSNAIDATMIDVSIHCWRSSAFQSKSYIKVPFRSDLSTGLHIYRDDFNTLQPVEGDLTLPMSSNTSNGYTLKASRNYIASGYDMYRAFDNVIEGTGLWSTGMSGNGWLAIDIVEKAVPTTYLLQAPHINVEQMAQSWNFEGSNDGVNWVILDSQTDVPSWSSRERRYYNISSEVNMYQWYRLNVTSNFSGWVSIGEIEIFGLRGEWYTQRRTFICVSHREDLLSSIYIKPTGRMIATVDVTPVYIDDHLTQLQIKAPNDLKSHISISARGRMRGSLSIIPPPTTKINITPFKDAFVRSGVPRLNYGAEQEMLVGMTGNMEEFNSFLAFDISNIPIGQKITKAILKLYVDQTSLQEIPISLYEILDDWTENGVTWASTPLHERKFLDISVNRAKEYIEIDILSVIQSWYSGESYNKGLILKSEKLVPGNFARIGTRERGAHYAPRLEIEYYSSFIGSFGNADVSTTITAQQNKYKDLKVSLVVKSTWDKTELRGTFKVFNPDMLETSLSVSRDSMKTQLTVKRNEIDGISSTVVIRNKRDSVIASVISISRDSAIGNMIVRQKDSSSLESWFQVRRTGFSDLFSGLSANNPEISGGISIFEKSLISGEITVIKSTDSDLKSIILVRRSEYKDIHSVVNVWSISSLISGITVKSGYLASAIIIPFAKVSDFRSTIIISEKYASDLNSSILVSMDEDGSYAFIM